MGLQKRTSHCTKNNPSCRKTDGASKETDRCSMDSIPGQKVQDLQGIAFAQFKKSDCPTHSGWESHPQLNQSYNEGQEVKTFIKQNEETARKCFRMRASGAHSLSQDNETLFEFLNKNYFD
jgi:hypothetical protein